MACEECIRHDMKWQQPLKNCRMILQLAFVRYRPQVFCIRQRRCWCPNARNWWVCFGKLCAWLCAHVCGFMCSHMRAWLHVYIYEGVQNLQEINCIILLLLSTGTVFIIIHEDRNSLSDCFKVFFFFFFGSNFIYLVIYLFLCNSCQSMKNQ